MNAGSLEKPILRKHGGPSPEALVESALGHVRLLEDLNFDLIKISLKASDPLSTVAAYKMISEKTDYPLHIGVTEAGPPFSGGIKSAAGLAILLYLGIGDTLRVSLTADPVLEVQAAYYILRALGLRRRGVEIISCPALRPIPDGSFPGRSPGRSVCIRLDGTDSGGHHGVPGKRTRRGTGGGRGDRRRKRRGSPFPQRESAPEGQGRRDGVGPAERGGGNQKKILKGNLMRFSKKLLQTYREDPAEAEAVSHKLMVRAGMVRQLAAGLYILLPLGLRCMNKVNAIIREEMNAIGGQEISMPILHPAEIWQQSGRWYDIGDEMFRLKDRTHRDMVLGMTHEEVVAWLAAREIRSYRDLPQIWYQIQTKLRDEARPKSGVLRTREFMMKDSYSLDLDAAGLERELPAALRGLLQDL